MFLPLLSPGPAKGRAGASMELLRQVSPRTLQVSGKHVHTAGRKHSLGRLATCAGLGSWTPAALGQRIPQPPGSTGHPTICVPCFGFLSTYPDSGGTNCPFLPLMVGAGLPNTSGTFPWSIMSVHAVFILSPQPAQTSLGLPIKQLLRNPNARHSIPQAPLATLAQTPPVLGSLSLTYFQPLSPWGPLGSLFPLTTP